MSKKGATTKVGTTATDSGKDFSGNGVEGDKGAASETVDQVKTSEAEATEEKQIVTGGDVVKAMRERGVRI